MDWVAIISAVFGGSIVTGLSTIAYFKPKLKEAMANAQKAETEAVDQQHNSLAKRLTSMEELYAKQGEILDSVRKQLLELSEAKAKSDLRVTQVEVENQQLRTEVSNLKNELDAYKVLVKGRSS